METLLPSSPTVCRRNAVHGVKASIGSRADQQDAYSVVTDFCSFSTERIGREISALNQGGPTCSASAGFEEESFHYYGVFDGHGGPDIATHCANRLSVHLRECLTQCGPTASAAGGPASPTSSVSEQMTLHPDALPNNVPPTAASATLQERGAEGASAGAAASFGCDDLCRIFKTAFLKTDNEGAAVQDQERLQGSTAVCAIVGTSLLCIAHCGDSRAVLIDENDRLISSNDHTLSRADEVARVEAAGGRVLRVNGHRVMGLLAMTRAMGDYCLRPYGVVPDPEVTIMRRSGAEILILASDGLWDVVSSQEACELTRAALNMAATKGAMPNDAARVAAAVLTKIALDRGTMDNVTCLVVDLR